jgi:hypothetical protein
LDDLEKGNVLMSGIFLLYSLAVSFIVGFISTKEIWLLISGILSYSFGILLTMTTKTKRRKIKHHFTSHKSPPE